MMRHVFTAIALLAAAAATMAGAALHWVNHTAHAPEPTRDLVASIVRDEAVIGAAANQLEDSIKRQLPEAANQIPRLRAELERLITAGVDHAVVNESARSAWQEVVDETRSSLVSALLAYGSGQAGAPPTVTVDLAPFVDMAWDSATSAADSRLRDVLGQVERPGTVQVRLAQLPAQEARLGGQTLAWSSYWWAAYAAAAALLVVALAAGSGATRWVLLAVAAAVTLAGASALRAIATQLTFHDPDSELVSALGARIATQLGSSLVSWLDPLRLGCCAVAAFGVIAAVVAGLRRRASGGTRA